MPLKHFAETVLVVLLGALILVTGFFTSTLPLLPEGLLPALILLGITLLYPLALYPMLRNNRADYSFRLLHFVPAMIVGVWLLLQLIALWLPFFNVLTALYTWGWTLAPVLLGIFLLMLFCISVLRRWVPRLAILTLLVVPFMAVAVVSGLMFQWERSVAMFLWQGTWWNVAGTGSLRLPGSQIAMQPVDTNLSSSADAAEQAWRDKLRELQNRTSSSSSTLSSSESSTGIPPFPVVISSAGQSASVQSSSSSTSSIPPLGTVIVGQVSTRSSSSVSIPAAPQPAPVTPPSTHLPKSGLVTDILPFFFVAGFCTVVQIRANRRKLVAVFA